jgi:hypothetical protein
VAVDPELMPTCCWYPLFLPDAVARMHSIGTVFGAALNTYASKWIHLRNQAWYGQSRFGRPGAEGLL